MKKKSFRKTSDTNESDPTSEKDDLDSQIETKSVPSDESLGALLRDVFVPSNLKTQLNEIPFLGLEPNEQSAKVIVETEQGSRQETVVTLQSKEDRVRSQSSRRLAIGLRVVAGVSVASVLVIGILVIGFILSTDGDGNSVVGDSGSSKEISEQRRSDKSDLAKQNDNGSKPMHSELETDTQLELQIAATDEAIESANLRLQELEIARLKANLRLLKSISRPRISSREFESITLAVAAEATEDFGGSAELARMQCVSVIENYPSSIGAKIATQNLEGRLH